MAEAEHNAFPHHTATENIQHESMIQKSAVPTHCPLYHTWITWEHMGQFVPTSMTGCISTAANHKPYNSTHTHTHLKSTRTQSGTGVMLQTGNRWPAGGKKRQKNGMPKKARERMLPSPLFLSPSSLHTRLEGKGRLRLWWCLVGSVGSGSRSEWWSSLGDF